MTHHFLAARIHISILLRPHFLVNLYFRCSGDRAAPEDDACPKFDELLCKHWQFLGLVSGTRAGG